MLLLDYEKIAACLHSYRIVAMGESTHGTHEFFVAKVEIFKLLIQKYGFNTFFIESVDDHCAALDTYVRTGKGDIEALVNHLFYFYRSHELLEFFNWLRQQHQQHPVQIIGLDERGYVKEYASNYDLDKRNLRDKRMALVIKNHTMKYPTAKCMVWAHDDHIAAYVNAPLSVKEQLAPMGRHLRRWYKKDYYNVALLFGQGHFSAASIDESGTSSNAAMVTHTIKTVPKDSWEYKLSQQYQLPIFLEGPSFKSLARRYEVHKKRSIGWGLKDSQINESMIWIDLSQAYSSVLFFPRTRASNTLEQ